jgi:hypothetical protein
MRDWYSEGLDVFGESSPGESEIVPHDHNLGIETPRLPDTVSARILLLDEAKTYSKCRAARKWNRLGGTRYSHPGCELCWLHRSHSLT